MHAAKVESSPRLQRVLALISDGSEHSTRDIAQGAEVCAVSSCVAELRAAGAVIHCRQVMRRHPDGTMRRLFYYRMTTPPEVKQ